MVAAHLIPIFQVIILLWTPLSAYPVFGTKRFNGRTVAVRRPNNNYNWGTPIQTYQQFIRSQRHPMNYYEMYPYNNRDYQDDYYYLPDTLSYPVYIPPPRTSKYEVYQAVLPYYYEDVQVSRPDYYGYEKNGDSVGNLEEEMLQEAEREEREEAQPIGQEVLYENDGSNDDGDSIDDINAAFLQNLIMAQMYNDAPPNSRQRDYYGQYLNDEYLYDDGYDTSSETRLPYQEDEDVLELKQLARMQKQNTNDKTPTAEERLYMFKNNNLNKQNRNTAKRDALSANKKEELSQHGSVVYKVKNLAFSDRKPTVKPTGGSTTVAPKITTDAPKSGQKEEVLIRPATPVRHPFSGAVLDMIKDEPERKREPSVYDTIKHMLDMEKNLQNDYRENEVRPPMRKRIVSSEDSLTHQLTVLKKAQ